MFKANLWFAGFHQGLTVKQNWVEVTDFFFFFFKEEKLFEEMRKKTRIKNLNRK